MLKNAIKISDYPYIEIDLRRVGRIMHEAFLLGYAKENYGAKFIQKNYLIPLSSIRSDLLRFIGIENVKPSYTNLVLLWSGNWHDAEEKSMSYIYEWNSEESASLDYIFNKHGKTLSIDNKDVNRYFILNQAPLPSEQTTGLYGDERKGDDPNPNTVKIVDKIYIDGRFDGWRTVHSSFDQSGTIVNNNIALRSYTCFYYIDSVLDLDEEGFYTVNFVDNTTDQRGGLEETIKNQHKHLTFYVRIKKFDEYWTPISEDSGHTCNIRFKVNGVDAKWTYDDELNEIFRQETLSEHINLKFNLYYIGDELKVIGGAMFGRNQSYGILKELSFEKEESDKDSTRNIPLLEYRGKTFISQYYTFEEVIAKGEEGAVQTISFNTDGLENELEYTWRYYLLTPYWNDTRVSTEKQSGESWSANLEQNIRFGDNIYWTSQEISDYHPKFQPNRLYCLEFTRLLDGILVGRVLWNVSLVKKKRLDLNRILFTFDLSQSQEHELFDFDLKEPLDFELNLTRWFSPNHNYNIKISWGDYIHYSHIVGNPRDGFLITDRDILGEETTYTSNEVKHVYRIGGDSRWPNVRKTELEGSSGKYLVEYLDKNGDVITDPEFFDIETNYPIVEMFMSVGAVVNVTMSGDSIPFLGTEEGEEIPERDCITDCLTSATVPVYYSSPLKDARALFCNCKRLSYIDGRFFRNCTDSTDFSMMFKNTKIKAVQPYMLYHCLNIENVSGMFEGSLLASIPSNFFKCNSKIKDISSIFCRCANLRSISDGLFDSCNDIENVRYSFKQLPRCEYVPSNLLSAENHPNIKLCKEAFYCGDVLKDEQTFYYDDYERKRFIHAGTTQGFKSEIPDLSEWVEWEDEETAIPKSEYHHVYTGCDNAENYDEIPFEWREVSQYKDYYTPIEYASIDKGKIYISQFKQEENDVYTLKARITETLPWTNAYGEFGATGTKQKFAYIAINNYDAAANTFNAVSRINQSDNSQVIKIPKDEIITYRIGNMVSADGIIFSASVEWNNIERAFVYSNLKNSRLVSNNNFWGINAVMDSMWRPMAIDFYELTIERDGLLIAKYIPCIKESTGLTVIYDIISKCESPDIS